MPAFQLFVIPCLSFCQPDEIDADTFDCPYVPNVVMEDCDLLTDDGFKAYLDEEISGYKMLIYNRWGEIVFVSDDPDERWYPWDDNLLEGVYVWAIQENTDEDFDGIAERSEFRCKGHITYLK